MAGSDSEAESQTDVNARKGAKEELDAPADAPGAPAQGAVIAEAAEAGEAGGKDEDAAGEDAAKGGSSSSSSKPSNTLIIRNVSDELDASDLEMRLTKFGDLFAPPVKEGEGTSTVFTVKFKHVKEAFEAREKLNGKMIYDVIMQVDFGAQEVDHYKRKNRTQGGRNGKTDLDGPNTSKKNGGEKRGMRAWDGDAAEQPDGPAAKKARTGAEGETKFDASTGVAGKLKLPPKCISKWSESLSFEQQLEDFMKMPRRGMYNRYLVLGKLPPELRTGSAIWQMVTPVQRDIMHIEMLTCFGKPVAHVALRSATAAAAMHRIAEQVHPNLTVAFAPPRRASKALWLGNIDDFVNRQDIEVLLGKFGKLVNGMRYLPSRTCAFATFTEVAHAVEARNFLYGLEVQKNQYLNIDFVEEWAADIQEAPAANPWGMPMPWGMPPGPPGSMPQMPPWGMPPMPPGFPQTQGKDGGRRGGQGPGMMPGMPFPGMPGFPMPPGAEQDARGRGRKGKHSRTRSRNRRDASGSQPKRGGRGEASPGARVAVKKQREKSQKRAPTAGASETEADNNAAKAKVKLYKMGEFCCNIVANFVKGKEGLEVFPGKLHIDQRTKIDHCRSHLDRAGNLATIWHFSAADRKDCAAYDALCDYFVEKDRVGLVQTPAFYVYIVPPVEKYLTALGLPSSNFVVGLQIPIKK